MDDLSFCSSCLICAKLCVHPKVRVELNDCNLPTPTSVRPTSKTSKGSAGKSKKSNRTLKLRRQISSFARCVSKFCELFDSQRDKNFLEDVNKFFKFTTLSSNCPLCEDCQQRIRLISKVMIQIESLQSQLIQLKKFMEKDVSVQFSAENEATKHNILNNKMEVFIKCDAETRLFREKLKEKLRISLARSNAVKENNVGESAVIPEINISHQNNANPILFDGAVAVADVKPQFALNDDGLNLFCDDLDMKPDLDNDENLEDNFDDNIDYWGDVLPEMEKENNRDVVTADELLDHNYTNKDAVVETQDENMTLTSIKNKESPTIIIVEGSEISLKCPSPEKFQVSESNAADVETSESEFEPGSDWHAKESDNDECIKKNKRHQARNKKGTNKPFEDSQEKRPRLKCTFVDPVKGECKVRASYQDGLDAHINRCHKNIPEAKSFQCNLCPFATGAIRRLTLHKKRHAGIKDVTCEFCGMSFLAETHLLGHKRKKHGEPYPIHCKICKKGFNRKLDLKLHHYRNHEDGEEYTHQCSVCNEGFYSNTHLLAHMARHAERTFKCDECPKAYPTKASLQKHKRTHTGIRPFACDICDWKFYTQQKLDLHRSIHTKKRPFLCQQCGFSCRLKELLTSHLKVHENNKLLAEQGIERAQRMAKPRNRRMKTYADTVPLPPVLPTSTHISTETFPEITAEQVESEIVKQ